MVPLPLWKRILKVLPRFHLDLEYFSSIPLVSGASVIVEMYLDGFAATVCVVFFKFIILQTAHLIEELHHEGCVAIIIIHRAIRCIQFQPQFYHIFGFFLFSVQKN